MTLAFGRNVVRVPGRSAADVAAAAAFANYSGADAPPLGGWLLDTSSDWREEVLDAQFAATPVNAGLLLTNHDYLPLPSEDVMRRLRPVGFPNSTGIQGLLMGTASQDVFRALHDLDLKLSNLTASSKASLALKVVPYRGGFARVYSSNVVVISQEARARDFALPAGAWSAFSGDSVALVKRSSVPGSTATLLAQRQKLRAEKPTIYVVGPTSVISSSVEQELGAYGRVVRVAGAGRDRSPIEAAIDFARFHDPRTGFGWGLVRGPASVTLVDRGHAGDATGAFDFAGAGPRAPLLLTEGPHLAAPVAAFLRGLQTPVPGHGFVMGDTGHVPDSVLSELDPLLE
jgi:hypothetical protein